MTMLPEPTEVMPTRKPATKPIDGHPDERLQVGGRTATSVLDFFLEEQESRNTDQQNPDRNRNEVIYPIAIDVSQMNQQTYA